MTQQYVHQELDQDYYFSAGFYTPRREVKLKYNGREVLYIVGHVVVESSCCGTANWSYGLVPGYIVNWQNERNEAGLPVSEVESVSDEAEQEDIRKMIKGAEGINAIEFR